jgi:hypothetical protein
MITVPALLLAALLGLLLPTRAVAAEVPPVVVELFTSQGCKSCPPADAILEQLAARPDVLALGFHVDYWNYGGWIDPWAAAFATERQRQYQRRLNGRFVYTPEAIVGGRGSVLGSEGDGIDKLIAATAVKPAWPAPGLRMAWREDGALLVRVGDVESPPEPATLWLVGYDAPRMTRVLHGENEGKTLKAVRAVRSFRRLGTWVGYSEAFMVAAAEAAELGDGGIAVLLQLGGDGPIIDAAHLDLPPRQ